MIDLSPAEMGDVEDTSTVVRVPASFSGEIEVHSDSGEVFAENVHGLAGLYASTSNGNIVTNNVTAAKLDAINENGDTLLSAVEAEVILATNNNGDISAQRLDIAASNIESVNGDIYLSYLGAEDSYHIDAHTNLGDIDALAVATAPTRAPSTSTATWATSRSTSPRNRGRLRLNLGLPPMRRHGRDAPSEATCPRPPSLNTSPPHERQLFAIMSVFLTLVRRTESHTMASAAQSANGAQRSPSSSLCCPHSRRRRRSSSHARERSRYFFHARYDAISSGGSRGMNRRLEPSPNCSR